MRTGARFYRGFTIIELVVVMVIAGVLATIGLVGYSSVREGVQDSTAEGYLLALVPAQDQTYGSKGSFASSPTAASALYNSPPSFLLAATPSESESEVSIASAE